MTAHPRFDSREITKAPESDVGDRRTDEDESYVRTQFLRRVAHDIASPTGVMTTVIDELASESRRPELAAMARRGIRRLLRLSEQLALVAELEAGTWTPNPTLEDLGTLAKVALDNAIAIDGRRDVTVAYDMPSEQLTVEVDRRLVISVLREVVGNALRLASSRVNVEVGADRGVAILCVEDDGSGFSDEVRAALGERFTARSGARGLGLSLSMARDVLASHGGSIDAGTSTLPPGRRGVSGAAVVIRLPLR